MFSFVHVVVKNMSYSLVSKVYKFMTFVAKIKTEKLVVMLLQYIFLSNAPYILYGLRGLPSWAWQKCNRLLRLGRP